MAELFIDTETFSNIDIRGGIHKYVSTSTFRILLLAYSFDDEPVTVIDLANGEEIPERVLRALYDPSVTKVAFNANFEIAGLKTMFPDLPAEQWACDSVLALYNAYPASLDMVAKAMELTAQKDSLGKSLIKFFCQPNKDGARNLPGQAPDRWAAFIEYNRQDVAVERAIHDALKHNKPSEIEHQLWLLDREINERGIAVCQPLVANAITLHEAARARLIAEAQAITGLDNPNSPVQVRRWLGDVLGREVDSISQAAVAKLLKGDLPGEARRLLHIRRELGQTSVKKYTAMASSVCADGRLHDIFRFYGAPRTGRWSGRGVQLHNLRRNTMKDDDLDLARQLVIDGEGEIFSLLYDVHDTLSQLVRTALVPAAGSRFIVADFAAIEARALAWLAGERWRLDAFAAGKDIYCETASAMFGVPVEKHGANEELRHKGKVAELACGYGGSVGALKAMGAAEMGLTDEELQDIVNKWRKTSPHIVRFWYRLEEAALNCLRGKESATFTPSGSAGGCPIKFFLDGPDMRLQLPSGRLLTYLRPRLGENRWGNACIEFQGIDQLTHKWGYLKTYGGKLAENLTQAVARDCLAYAMLRLDKAGYHIVMHVHDEVIIEAVDGTGSVDEVIALMTAGEPWSKGLPLAAEGFETKYYKKE